MKISYILVTICLLIAIILPVSAGTAKLAWYNNTGSNATTAVDTNIDGTFFYVAFANGTIIAYNVTINATDNTAEAIPVWRNQTNATSLSANKIKKMVSDDNGNLAWISEKNQTGYIAWTGAVMSKITFNNSNVTDVALRSDGGVYAVTLLKSGSTPSSIKIFNPDGSIYAQNNSFGTQTNWTRIGYDPTNQWILTANESSNRVYFWCITAWQGWEEFNPSHTASKNASQRFIDSFPYRESINITASASTKGIIFANNLTNTSTVLKINDTLYQYNRNNIGTYFWWTRTGNLTNASNVSEQPQEGLLNLSLVSGQNYYVVFRPITGVTNYTFYMGNGTLNNSVFNQSWTNNGTLFRTNITSTQSWTAPVVSGGIGINGGVTGVNLTMYGGGGGGQSGSTSHPGVRNGAGGSASTVTQYNNIMVTPGVSYTVTVGGGGAANTAGANSSFNNVTGIWNATGGAAGTGYTGVVGGNGNTTIPGYPTSGTGGTGYDQGWNCIETNYNPGSAGGVGYGSGGGGGGGYYDYNCGYQYPGAGASGSSGIVQISYYINDVPVYTYGSTPKTTLHTFEYEQTSTSLNQTQVQDYVNPVVGIATPPSGSVASLVSDQALLSGQFYQQYMSTSGFGVYYCGTSQGVLTSYPGTPLDVKISSGLYSIEGRGVNGIVYGSDAVVKAFAGTGGTVRSVDIAATSGLLAAFGGDDGKVYMLAGTPWYAYYTGSGTSPVTGVAVSWNGECVVVTRQDGLVEYYVTNVTIAPTPTPSYVDAQVRVYKDSTAYANQPVTIYSSTAYNPYVWAPAGTSYTDGGGTFTYTTTTGTYYKFVVNNNPGTTSGEGEVIWQSNTASSIVQIFIVSASTPYEWNAYYNAASNNVTVVYSDTISPTSVIVTIKDLKTNLDVLTRVYYSTPHFTLEYHDQLGNGTYQVNVIITRLGMSTRDQRTVMSPNTYGTILPNDQYITWAISTFVLMLIAGMFSYSNSKRGALAVVVVAVLMMIFKLLPMGLMTVAMLAAIFAVMSLFASRVQ